VVVPIVVALLVVAAAVGAQQGWFSGGGSAASNASPSVMASRQTAQPTPSPTSATSATETPSASATTPAADSSAEESAAHAEQVLEECRSSVEAADDVLEAAEEGIGHWSEHVQAQTDANAGDISETEMDAIFTRTRKAGDDDVRRYEDAVDEAVDRSASCRVPQGAPAEIADKLENCAERDEAQQPVLEAAKDAMDDWESHLADMRRSASSHVHDARGVWLRAWRAAPRHIKAYDKAEDKFDAPRC
jgi:hypothetical protein